MTLIDRIDDRTESGGPARTEIHSIRDVTVRITVGLDMLEYRSHALLEVLTKGHLWTELAVRPTGTWWREYHDRRNWREASLDGLVEKLLAMADVILGAPPAPPELPKNLSSLQRSALKAVERGEVYLTEGKTVGISSVMMRTLTRMGLVRIAEGTYDKCMVVRTDKKTIA